MVNIFITGLTGYIGGDLFHNISSKHPEYKFSALIRDKKVDLVRKACPDVEIVVGDLDDSDILIEQAAKADIVIHTADASDHEGAAKAIAEGLAKGHSKEKPGFWLHTGGTGILTYTDSEADKLGEWTEKEYNDWSGVKELTTLPDSAFHRGVDKIVLEAGTKNKASVKTAIVCPPTIYGKGRGPSANRGRQVYELAKLVLEEEYTPIIGAGKARWNYVHVYDLSDAFLALTEAAAKGDENPELWGDKGYHFTEAGEHIWGDLSRAVAKKALELKYIKSDEENSLDKDKAIKQAGFEAVSWGFNSRGRAERLNRTLGWKPTQPSIFDEVENIVKDEHERLQKK
ncbi:protein of unknown function [Taphrina deformans PYCC 5710]|uniref:NAD-dependent epimerase/dehydratase domain-containing protein n=1 Tax=Taphrina deformans (strain PYCC 5710 / ATCC 11124 / CBS 356.35 / IMI 108563 / JCM 9778 / NBRC 8474) TaxID=1097556 RepID=R4XDW9_TAPDE|nr:protein of unknown function [Taphrina deformans PYCC 5710]|eukprot:CCG84066.1 protein of unknown function [Taphrina deformans PYCC 5710]